MSAKCLLLPSTLVLLVYYPRFRFASLRGIVFQGRIGAATTAESEAEATEQLHLLSAVAASLQVLEVKVVPAIIKEIEALPAVVAKLRTARAARERAIA